VEKSRICDNRSEKDGLAVEPPFCYGGRETVSRAQLLYDYFSLHPRVGPAIVIVRSARGKRVGEGSTASNAVGIEAVETRRIHRWTLSDGMV
jgi:hypothetical protein